MRILHCLVAALIALSVAGAGTARAEWRRAESPRFVVYADMTEQEIRTAAEALEQFDAILRRFANVKDDPDSPKLVAYLVGKALVPEVFPGAGRGLLGRYVMTPDRTAMVASTEEVEEAVTPTGSRLRTKIRYLAARSTLQHEYAHHFMLQNSLGGYPQWYVEGFAEYYSTVTVVAGNIDLGAFELVRVISLRDGLWTPMREIMSGAKSKANADFVSDLYAQGWLAVSYFNSTPERQLALEKYLAAVRGGEKDLDKAIVESTGMTFREFDSALQKYMNSKIVTRQFQGWEYSAPAIQVSTLPEGQSKTLLLDARLRLRASVTPAEKARTLEDVRKVQAANANDAFTQLLAARAEIDLGDIATGRALAQAVVAAQPDNADAHYLIGLSLMEEGRKDESMREQKFKEARPHLARAFKRDPHHVGALYQTGLSLMAGGDMNENTANILLLAHQLAPQVGEISINTATVLESLGRRDDAIAILLPVANNPHGGERSEAAQAMLDALRGEVSAAADAEVTSAPPG